MAVARVTLNLLPQAAQRVIQLLDAAAKADGQGAGVDRFAATGATRVRDIANSHAHSVAVEVGQKPSDRRGGVSNGDQGKERGNTEKQKVEIQGTTDHRTTGLGGGLRDAAGFPEGLEVGVGQAVEF